MYERGKSDEPIVPEKPTNKEPGAPSLAEGVEGRGSAKGNSGEQNIGPDTGPGSVAKRAHSNTAGSEEG
jgi:hypothetical protein